MNNQIQIPGLSEYDCRICDLLWQCDTDWEVQNLIAMMPAAMQDRALVLRDMIIAAELDSYMEVADEVRDYLCGC